MEDMDAQATADAILSMNEESTSADESVAALESEEGVQAADSSSDSQDEESAEEPREGDKTVGRSSKLQKLIESKGGDEEKFAESIYQQMNSAAALAKKVAELETRLTQAVDEHIETSQRDEHPDIKELQQEIKTLESQEGRLQAKARTALIEIGKAERELAKLEGKLEVADDFEKPKIEQLKFRQEQIIRGYENEYAALEEAGPRIQKEKKVLEKQLKGIHKDIEAERVQRRDRQKLEAQASEQFGQTVFQVVASTAKQYGIPEKSLGYVNKLVLSEAAMFLRSLPAGAPGFNESDLKTFTAKVIAEYAEDRGIVKKAAFNKLSNQKLATAGTPKKPLIANLPNAPTTAKETDSADFWKNRARKMLAAG